MINIVYVSAAVIALSFVVLVYFVVKTLKTTNQALKNVAATLEGLEGQMDRITDETTTLLQKTNDLADDLKQKTEALDSVFVAIKDVGDSVHRFNHSVQSVSRSVAATAQENSGKVTQAVQWSHAIFDVWKWMNERRKKGKKIEEGNINE